MFCLHVCVSTLYGLFSRLSTCITPNSLVRFLSTRHMPRLIIWRKYAVSRKRIPEVFISLTQLCVTGFYYFLAGMVSKFRKWANKIRHNFPPHLSVSTVHYLARLEKQQLHIFT